ncbi:MAG: leucine-rich repeat protein [Lachnospiraceae bacterium]|nr:leucine-rich repeat protein [Lachnospiraceae bacterium]
MKCPKCGRLWDVSNKITSSTYVCPYCGDAVDSYGQSKKNLGEILLGIKSDYGDEVIDDISRLNALLMDYAPEMSKERKLVINALKEGVLTQLRRGFDDDEAPEFVIRRCVSFLVTEMWVTETAARYAVDAISCVLGVKTTTITEEIREDNNSGSKQLIKGDFQFGSIVRSDDLKEYESIGYKAFASNKELEEIEIPENIRMIYPKAFVGCSALKRVLLGRSISRIGRAAFDGCTSIELFKADNNPVFTVSNGLLIEKSEKRLLRSVNTNVAEISIVNGVKIVCKKAFERSVVERVRIPGSVDAIEEDAFYLTLKLERLDVDKSNTSYRSIDGVLHSRDGKVLLRYPQGKKDVAYYLEDSVSIIGRKAFSCSTILSSITFASGLKEIGENAFEYCVGIENLMFPRSVETIGERAFQYCEKLSSIMLPQGIIRIGDCAFQNCKLLKTVSIPRSVMEIGNMAFWGCKSLSKVVVQDNVRFIGDKAFGDCPEIEVSVKGNEYVETYCKTHGIKCSKV